MAKHKTSTPAPGNGRIAKQQVKEPVSPANGKKKKEVGGPSGPEPTRYGDWERNGRCVDF